LTRAAEAEALAAELSKIIVVFSRKDRLSAQKPRNNQGAAVGDQEVVGRVGLVTASIAPGRLGEVKVAIRGGSEAFHAYAMDPKDAIPRGTRVFVVEYFPPRTIVVSLA
jgi:membrane protein implicated in regulation of membrane protease activity